ncbi:uncharacterized protein UHOD_20171 [Ustilago sp. UG-2017b]|nr:uncharacterized protein UHOD_20171 [Ustilago sp. UG-2017b]
MQQRIREWAVADQNNILAIWARSRALKLTLLQPYRQGKNRPMDLGKKLGQFRREVYGNTSKSKEGEEKLQKKRLGKKERMRLKADEGGAEGEKK